MNMAKCDPELLKYIKMNKHMLDFECRTVYQYRFIGVITIFLESEGLSLKKQIDTYLKVREELPSELDKSRFDDILAKNTDLEYFITLTNNHKFLKKSLFRWLEVNTACVERSFSRYKLILTPLRSCLKPSKIANIYLVLNSSI